MNTTPITIDSLLRKHRACRHGVAGSPQASRKRLETSKFLAEHYPDYDRLRLHLVNPAQHPNIANEADGVKKTARHLANLGWIEPADYRGSRYRYSRKADNDIRNYLRGHWLEEYVFEAFLAAGADEACYGQKLTWGGKAAPSFFEMDVIARKGEQLMFVSCKAISPGPEQGMSTELRGFMSEALSWDHLFSAGDAKVMIVTTADMVDERKSNSARYPQLKDQAKWLDQALVGVEQLKWDSLVECCRI